MMIIPSGVKVHLAVGKTDMRKGMDGLAAIVQETLKQEPYSGHLFVFRGSKASLIKILFWDGTGLCLFSKRLNRARFIWPHVDAEAKTIKLTAAQLTMLIDGIDWRKPERIWKPAIAC